MHKTLVLTFHGIRSLLSPPVDQADSFAAPYTVDEHILRYAVRQAVAQGCCTVGGLVAGNPQCCVILTFDDGLISDYEVAYGMLADTGAKATFFVTAGNVGVPGYCNKTQLRELAGAGREIASHGMHHTYLTTLSHEQVQSEIVNSKRMLEDLIGREVVSYAPVGGHYRIWMYEFAREVGYRAFATMAPGLTQAGEEVFLLRRNHIQNAHSEQHVSRLLARDRGMFVRNLVRYRTLETARRLCGTRGYDLFKGMLLKGGGRFVQFRGVFGRRGD